MPRLLRIVPPQFQAAELAAAMRESMAHKGLSPDARDGAEEIIDLAIHAAETARRTVLEICERASDGPVELASLHLACGLIQMDMTAIGAAIQKFSSKQVRTPQQENAHG